MGWSNRAFDHDRFQDELITVSIYLFFRMILPKKSATFWDLGSVDTVRALDAPGGGLWRGRSQIASRRDDPPEVVHGQARSFPQGRRPFTCP
jgi:hypothetical protein